MSLITITKRNHYNLLDKDPCKIYQKDSLLTKKAIINQYIPEIRHQGCFTQTELSWRDLFHLIFYAIDHNFDYLSYHNYYLVSIIILIKSE